MMVSATGTVATLKPAASSFWFSAKVNHICTLADRQLNVHLFLTVTVAAEAPAENYAVVG